MNKIRDEITDRIDLTINEENQLHLSLVDELFEELTNIESNLDKYSMDWVFEYAHNRIESVFEEEIRTTFVCLRDNKEEESIVKETNEMIKRVALSIKKNTRSFGGAQTFTTISEIIGSFIIIMLSHELTAYFVGHYSYLISATIIVSFFAIFKIFIEKRYVSKYNKKKQRKRFKSSLTKTRKSFVQMFLFYLRVRRFDSDCGGLTSEERHQKALLFIKENHPKLEFN